MNFGRKTFEHGYLIIDINQSAKRIMITWRGVSEARDPASFLTAILDELVTATQGRSVEVDFRSLEFMNSSTLALVMIFIKSLNAHTIPTVLLFDVSVDWQRINYQCMKIISRSLKSLQVEAV